MTILALHKLVRRALLREFGCADVTVPCNGSWLLPAVNHHGQRVRAVSDDKLWAQADTNVDVRFSNARRKLERLHERELGQLTAEQVRLSKARREDRQGEINEHLKGVEKAFDDRMAQIASEKGGSDRTRQAELQRLEAEKAQKIQAETERLHKAEEEERKAALSARIQKIEAEKRATEARHKEALDEQLRAQERHREATVRQEYENLKEQQNSRKTFDESRKGPPKDGPNKNGPRKNGPKKNGLGKNGPGPDGPEL